MSKLSIFLAAPMSGFKDELQYKKNRKNLIGFINKLNKKYIVYSEILHIQSMDSYEDPGQSAIKDFGEISRADVFIMYHPMHMQTSTLIELGYAVAKQKKIILIAQPDMLPYLALGLSSYNPDIYIVPSSELDRDVVNQVESILNGFLDTRDI